MRKTRVSWVSGAPLSAWQGRAVVHDVRVVFVATGVLLGCLPFTAELEEAWWNSERPGDSGGLAGVYRIAVPTEAGGLARPAGFGYYQDCRCRFFLLVKIV